MKKDLFISHASEDKDDFVRPLANLLKQYGLDIWYDEFELKLGSNIVRSIDKGIQNSRYGLLVLSKSFFGKNWTEYELTSLTTFEVEKGDVLIPIWKGVTVNEVRDFSPYLAAKLALSNTQDIENIAIKIIETVRPDIFSAILRKLTLEQTIKKGTVKKIDPSQLKHGPIRHLNLNEGLVSRIRLIRSSLWLGHPHSMEYWMDGFKRDLTIESEIRFWEMVSSCFLEALLQHDANKWYTGPEEKLYENLFGLIFTIAMSNDSTNNVTSTFQTDFVNRMREILQYSMPIYDIKEELPFDNK